MKANFDEPDFDFVVEFRKLFLNSPHCGSWTRASENCDYGDITTVSKDCYMCFNTGNSQNAYYCEDSRAIRDCTDLSSCEKCELSYECIDCDTVYSSNFCQDCANCEGLNYCFDLRRCQNCFGCVGLRNKQFWIFNEKYSKEKYLEKVKELEAKGVDFIFSELEKLKLKVPRMYVHQFDTENCVGDYVYHSKNCYMCFDTRHSEDSAYIFQANLDIGTRDSIDCGPIPTGMDLCYDVAYAHYLFNCNHLYWCGNLKDSEWCSGCLASDHLFGCSYMNKKEKSFYILNQEVEENYYWEKTKEINEDLYKRGIFTMHDLIFKDLSKKFEPVSEQQYKRQCQICGERFEIINMERDFLKKRNILLPIYCPECRSQQRIKLRNERKMYKRICDRCKKTLISTYPPDSKYIVYCLDCYWQEIA